MYCNCFIFLRVTYIYIVLPAHLYHSAKSETSCNIKYLPRSKYAINRYTLHGLDSDTSPHSLFTDLSWWLCPSARRAQLTFVWLHHCLVLACKLAGAAEWCRGKLCPQWHSKGWSWEPCTHRSVQQCWPTCSAQLLPSFVSSRRA